jgi:molybdopterin molybdotransferase
LLSVAEITQQWLAMQAIKASGAFVINGKEILADADSKIKNDWWNESWLPITDNLSGDYTAIDLDPTTTGTVRQIIEYWHDPSYRNCLGVSLKSWIENLTDKIKKNVAKYNADYNAFIEF